ncbi:Gfo/Idh/MocA family oxidoreductase [uncultured Serinicoccus sp.]|uniref:Gfo/Idh/MocA family protein n=1 Tax=uncultured Serinicoccus sp. TaxID=735514 RepID=UPI00261D980A|nr:Gfo/Idh/MocA family oxidoreductase [uncultured Serinicoccus sp.]
MPDRSRTGATTATVDRAASPQPTGAPAPSAAPQSSAAAEPPAAPDPSATLGVAVVGYSFMGQAHSNAWRNVNAFYDDLPQVRMQTLVGRDRARVGAAAEQLGWADVATDWREVLQRDDVDIVDVCTPGHLHAEVALAALAAGKHVLVEKPLANSVADCERLVEASRAPGAGRSMLGHNYRRVPALALARDLIEQGRVGQVRQVRLSYLQDWLADDQAPMSWRLRKDTAGTGVLGDLGSHAVDQLRFLLGTEVTRATGQLRTFVPERPSADGDHREQVDVDDAAWATLHTSSGAVASLEVSRMATGRKNALQIEVYGSTGSLRFDLERLNELVVTGANGGAETVLVTEPEHPYLGAWWPAGHVLGWDSTFTSQAADFLRAIATGEQIHPSFADGLAVQRVLEAIETSSGRGGIPVDLPA